MSDETYKLALKQRIDEVLHYIWDPIGVSDVPEARDEYASYADHVWREVLEGKSKSELSDYLTEVSTERMGLGARKSHDDEVAGIILDWADLLSQKSGL